MMFTALRMTLVLQATRWIHRGKPIWRLEAMQWDRTSSAFPSHWRCLSRSSPTLNPFHTSIWASGSGSQTSLTSGIVEPGAYFLAGRPLVAQELLMDFFDNLDICYLRQWPDINLDHDLIAGFESLLEMESVCNSDLNSACKVSS